MASLAIDFGGTQVKFGLIDQEGVVLCAAKVDSTANETIAFNLELISQKIRELMSSKGIDARNVTSIGIALPSIINSKENIVLSEYVKYTDANTFDFNRWALEEWSVPVILENDARAALVGEWKFGAGKEYANIVLLTLGTGVGSAVLIDGKLFRGSNFIGGNLAGHIAVNISGAPCNCGFIGCLETEASSWALPSIVERLVVKSEIDALALPSLNFFHLFSAADQGNEAAKKVIDHCTKTWAMAAVNVTHMYDPEVIIVSGGIMQRSNDILPHMQHYIDTYSWLSPGSVTVLPAQQVEYAGLLGMSFLSHSIQTT